MVTTTNSSKKSSKKFNLIFFIDSEKTYHYKFHFFIIKIIIIFLILLVISSVISIFFSLSIVKKNQEQEKYIISFKKDLLQHYFEKSLIKDEKKRDNEVAKNEVVKNEVAKSEVAKNEVVKNEVAKSEVAKSEVAKNEVAKKEIVKNEDQVHIIENSGIKIENPRIIQENDNTKVSFSLSNTNTEKNSISGRVCAVIFGVNDKGENVIYKIPEKMKLNSQNIPSSCKEGEQVKFSRLRPTEFNINVGKSSLNIKKINVFFSYGEEKGIVVNSF